MSNLTQYKLFIGDDKKNTLFGVTFSFKVNRDMLSVDIMIIIKEVDHEVVMLKDKKIFQSVTFKTFLKYCLRIP